MARRRVTRPTTRRRTRSAQLGPVSGMWLAIASACALTATLVESLTVIVVCVITSVVALVIGLVALYAPERVGAASAPVKAAPKPGQKPGKAPSRPRARRPSGARPATCSHRCRTSSAPKSTCRCKSPQCAHGSEARGGTKTAKPRKNTPIPSGPPRMSPNDDGSRSWLLSPEAKKLERRIVREEKERRRRERGL